MTSKRGVKGMGSIYELGDGRWRAQLDLGIINGKRVRKTRTCSPPNAQKKARDALKDLRREADKGLLPEAVTVAQWLDHWLSSVTKAREATKDGYRSKIKSYITPAIGHVPIVKLRAEHIRRMQQGMADKGRAASTIRQTTAILAAALRVAVDEGRIDRNPARMKSVQVEVRRKPHEHLSIPDAMTVVNTARTNRDRARLMAALWLGLRQSEALGLHWEQVHLGESPYVEVIQGARREKARGMVIYAPKSRESYRVTPMSRAVAEAFRAWRDESGGEGLVWPGPTGELGDPTADARLWREHLKWAGVPHKPLHGARGTAATIMLMDSPLHVVAAYLGHSNPLVTLQHYASTMDGQLAAASDALEQRMLSAGRQPTDEPEQHPDA